MVGRLVYLPMKAEIWTNEKDYYLLGAGEWHKVKDKAETFNHPVIIKVGRKYVKSVPEGWSLYAIEL